MPSSADTLVARLQADCTTAEAFERAVRASVEGQLKAADPLAAFRAFETSYEAERGEAFFDREGRDLRPDEVGR